MGTIFGVLTLVTGSIWARTRGASGGAGASKQLVLFLILFLFYSAYFMLRYSVEPGPRRERISAVYALFGVVLIPISFLAIRLAESLIHPIGVHARREREPDVELMLGTFLICLAGMLCLGRRALPDRARRQATRQAAAGAPEGVGVTSAEKYVDRRLRWSCSRSCCSTSCIYAFKLARLQREVGELAELAARRRADADADEPDREPERVA